MPPTRFPAEIQSALAHAMRDVARAPGTMESLRYAAARDLVCRHAHDTGLAPEVMIFAVRDVYGSIVQSDVQSRERLRDAFDQLMVGWVQAYLSEADRRQAERWRLLSAKPWKAGA